jgi:molecular chaperone GrpE
VVIRDKRRVDPSADTPREPASDESAGAVGADTSAPAGPSAREAELAEQLAERTADLQRLQAEYANYRKRVERDRVVLGEQAVGGVLATLIPVLDDLERARAHGDLSGPLKAVADQLEATVAKLGLESFGDAGDPFDPAIHEAVLHDESGEVSIPTATTVMRRGYRHAERLLRPAMVGVSDPAGPAPAPDSEEPEPGAE